MGKVGKKAVVKYVAKDTGISQETVSFVYDSIMDCILKSVLDIKAVTLPGIGIIYHNPVKSRLSNMTNSIVPPHKHLSFKPQEVLARTIRVKTREYPITSKTK